MIQEKSRVSLFLVTFSSVLLLGIIVGSITFVYFYQRLVRERNIIAEEVARLSKELDTRALIFTDKEIVTNENGTPSRKIFLNEGALGFSFQYPADLYFDLSIVERPWAMIQHKDIGDTILYGCFSKRLPPGPQGRETEPYWCVGSVEVRRSTVADIKEEYRRASREWIGMEEMDQGEIVAVDVQFVEAIVTDDRLPATKVKMEIKKKGTSPDVPSQWIENTITYLIPRNELMYVLDNGGFSGTIDETVFSQIVESIKFLR